MRNAAFIAVGVLLILLQANVYRLLGPLGLHGATPSFTLPMVVFLGVHEPSMTRGALLSFALGYALDILASAPIGLFTFVSVAIWWLARVAGVRLTAQTAVTRIPLAFGFSLVESGIVLMLLAVFGSDTKRPVELSSVILPHALSTALFAPLIFKLVQALQQGVATVHGGSEGRA
jgi:rod shape-determining protein MreD